MERKDTKRGRFYNGYPSVTTILSVLGKPALISWAAKEERILVLEAASLYYEEVASTLSEPLSRAEFIERVVQRMGEVKAHRRLMKEAADIGTQVHKRIEWELKRQLGKAVKGEKPELTHPKAVRSYERWEEWRETTKFVPLEIEITVRSDVHGYGGTADLLACVDDPGLGPAVEVIDWKTGKHIYGEALLQNAAYRNALKEMGIENHRGRIVRLPKEADDPEFETEVAPPLEKVLVPFLSLIPVWKWNREMEDRRREHGRSGPDRGAAANAV